MFPLHLLGRNGLFTSAMINYFGTDLALLQQLLNRECAKRCSVRVRSQCTCHQYSPSALAMDLYIYIYIYIYIYMYVHGGSRVARALRQAQAVTVS